MPRAPKRVVAERAPARTRLLHLLWGRVRLAPIRPGEPLRLGMQQAATSKQSTPHPEKPAIPQGGRTLRDRFGIISPQFWPFQHLFILVGTFAIANVMLKSNKKMGAFTPVNDLFCVNRS